MSKPADADPRALAQKMWAVNGAAIRALRLAAVKWERAEDFGHLHAVVTLVADMLEMRDGPPSEGNRILDVVIAATEYVDKPTAHHLKSSAPTAGAAVDTMISRPFDLKE